MSVGGVDAITGLPGEIPLYALYGQAKRWGFTAYDDEGQAIDLTVGGTSITFYVKRIGALDEAAALFSLAAAGLTATGDYYVTLTSAERVFMANGDALYYTAMLTHAAYVTPLAIARGPLMIEPSAYPGP